MLRILHQIFRTGVVTEPLPAAVEAEIAEIGARLEERIRKTFHRSLTIREVDAGSCNGCELEIHAMDLTARLATGDFCDFFFLSESELAVVMADVSGKGVPAAVLRGSAARRVLLQRINTTVFRDPEGLMANIARVTRHLAGKFAGRPDAVTMHRGVAEHGWAPHAGKIPLILQSSLLQPDELKQLFEDTATAMPVVPLMSRLGTRAGRTTGSESVPSKLGRKRTVPLLSSERSSMAMGRSFTSV